MVKQLLIFCILAISIAFTVSVYINDIGTAPLKTPFINQPIARYPVHKNKLRISRGDFPTSSFKLIDMINEYRRESGLPIAQTSPSLMLVAQSHANDLNKKIENDKEPNCGLYSWSENPGAWKGCCSNNTQFCMYKKPEEITHSYFSPGIELVFATNWTVRSEYFSTVLSAWKNSEGHNNVLLNKEDWSRLNWRSIGVGISGSVATVWFGVIIDPRPWAPESPAHPTQFVSPTKNWDFPRTTNTPTNYQPQPTSYPTTWNPNTWYPTTSYPTTWNPNTWYPTTSSPNTWYPTTSYPTTWNPNTWRPNTWHPTASWRDAPKHSFSDNEWESKEKYHHHIKIKQRDNIHEIWLIILSGLVVILLIVCSYLIYIVKRLSMQLRLQHQDTSCAIPEKFGKQQFI